LAYNSLVEKCSKYVEDSAPSKPRHDNQQLKDGSIYVDELSGAKTQILADVVPTPEIQFLPRKQLESQKDEKFKENCSRRNQRPPSLKMSMSLEHTESDIGLLEYDKKFKCDSPSYLIVPNSPFSSGNDMNFLSGASKEVSEKDFTDKINPIPLPPRGSSKLVTNTKRHIRKYPLVTCDSDGPAIKDPDALDFFDLDSTLKLPKNNLNIKNTSEESPEHLNIPSNEKEMFHKFTDGFIENNFPANEPTYENAHVFQSQFDDSDTLSLYFESVLEDDANKGDTMLLDSFPFFDSKTVESSDQTNSTKREKNVTDESFSFFSKHEPALKSNSYETDDNKMQDMRDFEFQAINNVSCEDLLDFSNKKPKGFERGLESDEVRIMYKVLSKKVGIFLLKFLFLVRL
jgi:hypothetical protein